VSIGADMTSPVALYLPLWSFTGRHTMLKARAFQQFILVSFHEKCPLISTIILYETGQAYKTREKKYIKKTTNPTPYRKQANEGECGSLKGHKAVPRACTLYSNRQWLI